MQVLSRAQAMQSAAIPALMLSMHWSDLRSGMMTRLESFDAVQSLKAEYESEADQLAIRYLWNTGYDPAAYITALEKAVKRGKFSSAGDRVRAAILEQASLPDRQPYVVNTPEFDLIRSKVSK